MFGILCSHGKEKYYASKICLCIGEFLKENGESIIIFTIDNVDLLNKELQGALIKDKKVVQAMVKFPEIIYNFSVQEKSKNIKKMRKLSEAKDINVINEVNRFKQDMIMDILSSDKNTKKYLLPYNLIDKDDSNIDFESINQYLIMPSKGNNVKDIINIQKQGYDYKIIYRKIILRFRKNEIFNIVKNIIPSKNYIMLEHNGELMYKNRIKIVRIYLQKTDKDLWQVIGKRGMINRKDIDYITNKSLEDISMSIIKNINNFIPSLGNAFIDWIVDVNKNSFFLHLGGIEPSLSIISRKEADQLSSIFYRNLIKYSQFYSFKSENSNYVD